MEFAVGVRTRDRREVDVVVQARDQRDAKRKAREAEGVVGLLLGEPVPVRRDPPPRPYDPDDDW